MKNISQKLFILSVLVCFIVSNLHAQKAYDKVEYVAVYQDVIITYIYGDGYPDASQMRIDKKTVSQDWDYDAYQKEGFIIQKYNFDNVYCLVILEQYMVNQGKPIDTIKGKYVVDNKEYDIIFERKTPEALNNAKE